MPSGSRWAKSGTSTRCGISGSGFLAVCRTAGSPSISGHSNRPLVSEKTGVLYVNPGSIGPRRFSLPVCLARMRITQDRIEAELVPLDV